MKKSDSTALVVPQEGWQEAQIAFARQRNRLDASFSEIEQFFRVQKTLNLNLIDERLDTLRGTVEAVVEMAKARKLLGREVMVCLNGRAGSQGNQNIYFEV